MIELTAEEQKAIQNGLTIHIQLAEIGRRVVVLLEEEYEKLLHEDEEDRRLQEGWQKLAYRGIALSLDDEP